MPVTKRRSFILPSTQQACTELVYSSCATVNTFILPECFIYWTASVQFVHLATCLPVCSFTCQDTASCQEQFYFLLVRFQHSDVLNTQSAPGKRGRGKEGAWAERSKQHFGFLNKTFVCDWGIVTWTAWPVLLGVSKQPASCPHRNRSPPSAPTLHVYLYCMRTNFFDNLSDRFILRPNVFVFFRGPVWVT